MIWPLYFDEPKLLSGSKILLFCLIFDRSNFNKGLNSVEIISFSARIFFDTLFSFSIFSFLFQIREFSFREQLDKKIENINITNTLFTQISV